MGCHSLRGDFGRLSTETHVWGGFPACLCATVYEPVNESSMISTGETETLDIQSDNGRSRNWTRLTAAIRTTLHEWIQRSVKFSTMTDEPRQ